MKEWLNNLRGLLGRQPKKPNANDFIVETAPQKSVDHVHEKTEGLIKGIEADLSFIKLRLHTHAPEYGFHTREGKRAVMNSNRENIDRIIDRIRDGKLNVRDGALFYSAYKAGRDATDFYCKRFNERTEVPLIWAYNNTALSITYSKRPPFQLSACHFVDPVGIKPEKVLLYPYVPAELHDENQDDALKFITAYRKVEETYISGAKKTELIYDTDEWRKEMGEKARHEKISEDEILEYADGYTLGVISTIFRRLHDNHTTPQLEQALRLLSETKG